MSDFSLAIAVIAAGLVMHLACHLRYRWLIRRRRFLPRKANFITAVELGLLLFIGVVVASRATL